MDATPHTPAAKGIDPGEPAPALLTARGRRTLAGLGLSLAIHVLLMGFLALVLLEGPAGEGDRAFGPAVELSTTAAQDSESPAEAWLDESLPDLAQAVPMPEIEPSPASASPSVVSTGAPAATSLAGGGSGSAEGADLSLGGAASGGASFFGVEASGSRIVYIVDVSGSMLHNGKIQALKRELLGSISSLPPGSEFAVIAFSDESATRALGGPARWRSATESGRAPVVTAVRGAAPSGGTQPLEAFRIAFDLSPKPEAAYFMTDGEIPPRDAPRVIGAVRTMNERAGELTPIHCIAFESQAGARDLRRIARQSRGTYTFVSGSTP